MLVVAGTARLVGTNVERICVEAAALLEDPVEYERRSTIANPYGDGKSAGRIVELLSCG